MKKPAAKKEKFDPFFQQVPWEIHRDEKQNIIGVVYLLPSEVRNEGIWKGVKRSCRN